ncbi:MAG TPA: OB-fold domain-containing protein [Bryobacteraceae bacterium]|nr:OB-fold domain-containing protein [Bryobacteraceae bacterium]
MRTGTVYTETVIYSAPEAFAKDVPYQTAIVSLEDGGSATGRVTARIMGDRVAIGDHVVEVEPGEARAPQMAGVPFFRKV